jgi:hypothetical protein
LHRYPRSTEHWRTMHDFRISNDPFRHVSIVA